RFTTRAVGALHPVEIRPPASAPDGPTMRYGVPPSSDDSKRWAWKYSFLNSGVTSASHTRSAAALMNVWYVCSGLDTGAPSGGSGRGGRLDGAAQADHRGEGRFGIPGDPA